LDALVVRKDRKDFPDDASYGQYMRTALHASDRVKARVGDDKVPTGTLGTYRGVYTVGTAEWAFVTWDGIRPNGCFTANLGGAPSADDKSGYCLKFESVAFANSVDFRAPGALKYRSEFPDDASYGTYVQSNIRVGDRVRARATYEKVPAGTLGTYHGGGHNPPAFVTWDGISPDGCFYVGEGGAPSKDDHSGYCVQFWNLDVLR
jgi:hypothetical protein